MKRDAPEQGWHSPPLAHVGRAASWLGAGGGPGWHGTAGIMPECPPLPPSLPPTPPPSPPCFSCPGAVPMQRFVCSLLPGPGEGKVEALSASPRLRNSFSCQCRIRPLPWSPLGFGSWLHWWDPAVPGKPDPCRFGGSLNDMGKLRHGASMPGRQEAAPTPATLCVPQFPYCLRGGAGICPMLRHPAGPSWPVGRRRAGPAEFPAFPPPRLVFCRLPEPAWPHSPCLGWGPVKAAGVLWGCGSLAGLGGTDASGPASGGGHPSVHASIPRCSEEPSLPPLPSPFPHGHQQICLLRAPGEGGEVNHCRPPPL